MPSKSRSQSKLMTAACKNDEFRKKVDIPKNVACKFHGADKRKYHKEDIDMNEELGRIKKLAGIEPKEEVAERVELTASDENPHKDAKASDVSQAMAMAKLKKTVEDRDDDDTDFTGLFTGVARGEINLDDSGKIAESIFGIIKELEEGCGKKHGKKRTYEDGIASVTPHASRKPAPVSEPSEPDITNDNIDHDRVVMDPAYRKRVQHFLNKQGVGESGSSEKKKGRKAAGSYGRPGSKDQKRDASKSSRRLGNEEIKKGREEVDEYMMFEKDSLSRIMVELIFEEMKKGKNAQEISEELSFSYGDVQPIFDHLKKKVSTITETGRPRGGPHIENVDYWDKPDEHLLYIIKDADAAIKANPDNPKNISGPGNYADQINDAYSVLGWRDADKLRGDVQEDGLPGYDPWKTASPYDNEPSEQDVDRAHEAGEDYGMSYLHTDKVAMAAVADLKNPGTDPDDRRGLWSDLISDVSGMIVRGLENDENMVLSDDQVKDLALLVVKKHMTM